jgi:hypothetical protein
MLYHHATQATDLGSELLVYYRVLSGLEFDTAFPIDWLSIVTKFVSTEAS